MKCRMNTVKEDSVDLANNEGGDEYKFNFKM